MASWVRVVPDAFVRSAIVSAFRWIRHLLMIDSWDLVYASSDVAMSMMYLSFARFRGAVSICLMSILSLENLRKVRRDWIHLSAESWGMFRSGSESIGFDVPVPSCVVAGEHNFSWCVPMESQTW